VPFFRRHIDDERAIDPSRARPLGEGRIAHDLDRVEIAHEHDRRLVVALAERTHHLQHIGQPHALGQCPFGGALDHWTIGHGIGEGYAQLDDIGAGCDHGVHQRHRGRRAGIAGRDEGNERGATARFEVFETLGDTAHRTNPS
jgi:hypothetical protein